MLFSFEKIDKSVKKKSLTFLSIKFLKKYYKRNRCFTFKEIIHDFFNIEKKRKNV